MARQTNSNPKLTSDAQPASNSSSGKRVSLLVPGSTANLGPGFDAVGLALTIYSRFTFEVLEERQKSPPLITLKGAIAQALPNNQNNLLFRILKDHWHLDPRLLAQIHITIETDIPLARGLGSSAAATIATLYASQLLAGDTLDKSRLLVEATAVEGHPDNVAASLLGGLVVSSPSEKSHSITAKRLNWPKQWQTIVVVPNYELATKKAREALPKQIPLVDAVYNVQKTALLMAAIVNQDDEALTEALQDKLHQPYRGPLIPEFALLKNHLRDLPILGCVISGAGPSLLIIVHLQHKQLVLNCLHDWSNANLNHPQILDLQVDNHGIQEINA